MLRYTWYYIYLLATYLPILFFESNMQNLRQEIRYRSWCGTQMFHFLSKNIFETEFYEIFSKLRFQISQICFKYKETKWSFRRATFFRKSTVNNDSKLLSICYFIQYFISFSYTLLRKCRPTGGIMVYTDVITSEIENDPFL